MDLLDPLTTMERFVFNIFLDNKIAGFLQVFKFQNQGETRRFEEEFSNFR